MASNEKLNALDRTDDGATSHVVKLDNSKKYNNSKRKINQICRNLTLDTKSFIPIKSVEQIAVYLRTKDKMTRILYSEISNYMFNMESEQRMVFLTNVESLLIFSLDVGNLSGVILDKDPDTLVDDIAKIIVKIYDHTQLVNYQIENMNTIFAQSISDAKLDLHKEIKGIEKEYISILGIFAAIVLAFVGGITFSSSVLQNIGKVSIYRLLVVVVMLAFVIVNVIWLLIKFIAEINDKDIKLFKIGLFDTVCGILMIGIIVAWALNLEQVAQFISTYLPWCK
jgi:hypothetical protein